MAATTDDIPILDDHFDTSFGDSGWLLTGESRSSSWFLGDDPCGPMVYLLDSAPPANDGPRFPVHHHGSDEFRLVFTGALGIGRTWLQPGQVRLQAAIGDYGPEMTGPDGCQELVLFPDRRGFMPEYPRQSDQQALGWLGDYFQQLYTGHFPAPDASEAAGSYRSLLSGSVRTPSRHGRVDTSFDDGSWPTVEGVRYSFWALGAGARRPLVLLVDASPETAEIPRMMFGTDQFRLILAGSCEISGQHYGAGDIRVQQAGSFLGPEITGPNGCRQMVVFASLAEAVPAFAHPAEAGRVAGPWADLGGDVGALLAAL
jgi:hypothetical protein